LKAAVFEAAFLEALARTAGAGIVMPELFDQFLVAVNDAMATLDGGFAVESPSGVCSSVQKLASLSVRRIFASSSLERQGF
jgi:hypothetical protein